MEHKTLTDIKDGYEAVKDIAIEDAGTRIIVECAGHTIGRRMNMGRNHSPYVLFENKKYFITEVTIHTLGEITVRTYKGT